MSSPTNPEGSMDAADPDSGEPGYSGAGSDQLANLARGAVGWLWACDPLEESRVESQARLLFLDTLGCMIAGLAKPELRRLAAGLAALETGTVQLPGASEALSPLGAAFTGGVAACWDEACEGLARAHGRPGLHAFPVTLALGLAGRRSFAEVLSGLVRGYEVGARMGERLRIGPGMHVDGIWGTFAAVAAAASLLDLDLEATVCALQGAGCQLPFSLYLPVSAGATVRNAYVGGACARGLLGAVAARAGLSAPPGAIDAFDELALRSRGRDAAPAPAGEWTILQGYLKPFAAVRHVHYGCAAAQRWRTSGPADPAAIRSLRLAIYAEALTYCGNRAPQSAIQAQFSLSYGLAWTLCHGDLGPEAYARDSLEDPQVRRLETLVVLEEDPGLTGRGRRGAALTVRTDDRTETVRVDAVAGDPDQPLSPDQTRAKFLRYVSPCLGAGRAERLAEGILESALGTPVDQLLGVAGESS